MNDVKTSNIKVNAFFFSLLGIEVTSCSKLHIQSASLEDNPKNVGFTRKKSTRMRISAVFASWCYTTTPISFFFIFHCDY